MVRDLQGNVPSDSHIVHAYSFRGELVLSMTVYSTVNAAKRESSF